MVNVAVAGGTSPTLGKSIVEAIVGTGKHQVIILSRKKADNTEDNDHNASSTTTKYGAQVFEVDYSSTTSIQSILESNQAHTLISVLKILDPAEGISIHRNLLLAAQSAKVERYILSDWSMAQPAHTRVDLLAHKAELHKLGTDHMRSALDSNNYIVECATIQNGGFLEYFSQGCADKSLLAGLEDDLMLEYIDIANGKLVIPCRSKTPLTPARTSSTSLVDIGRFVAASLTLPRGQMTGYIGVTGDVFSYDRVVDTLNSMGDTAVTSLKNVTYITAEECQAIADEKGKLFQEKIASGEGFDVELFKVRMVAQMYACLCGEEDRGGVVQGRMLNELCPDVETMKIDDLLRRAWKK